MGGACSSCLGLLGWSDDDERSRLLNQDDAQYGTNINGQNHLIPGHPHGQMIDPSDIQREREQLDRIVAQTSENLIDIFSMHTAPGQYKDNSRVESYKLLLQRTSPPNLTPIPEALPADCISDEEREMMEHIGKMAEEAIGGFKSVKGVGNLVVRLEVQG